MKRWATIFLGTAALAMAGCDSGGDGSSDTMDTQSRCATEQRAEDFVLGISKDGAMRRVTFVDAEPAQPIRGDNTWLIALSDLSEQPVEEAQLQIKAWMPDHGHGTPAPINITEMGEGEYELDPVNLFMAGYWEITVTSIVDDEADEAMFPLCVE